MEAPVSGEAGPAQLPHGAKQSRKDARKPRVGLAAIFACVAGLEVAWAGLLGNIGGIYLSAGALVMLIACIALGWQLRLLLRNLNWKKWEYNGAACTVVFLALIFCLVILLRPASRGGISGQTNIPERAYRADFKSFGFRRKREETTLFLGSEDNSITLPVPPPGAVGYKDIGRLALLAGDHEHPSQIQLAVDDTRLILNVKFAPIFGMPGLEMTNNELAGLPSDWDCNSSPNAMEIVDGSLTPVFQAFYKDDSHLFLAGAITFTNAGRWGVVLMSKGGIDVETGGALTKTELFGRIKGLNLPRLFRYPSWKYPAVYEGAGP